MPSGKPGVYYLINLYKLDFIKSTFINNIYSFKKVAVAPLLGLNVEESFCQIKANLVSID